jgi:hypothetical protein
VIVVFQEPDDVVRVAPLTRPHAVQLEVLRQPVVNDPLTQLNPEGSMHTPVAITVIISVAMNPIERRVTSILLEIGMHGVSMLLGLPELSNMRR